MAFDSMVQLVCIGAEGIVLAMVFHRRIWRILPVFSCYIAWTLITDLAATSFLFRTPWNYLRFYTVEAVADAMLQLLVIIELVWSVLRPILADRNRTTLAMLAGLIAFAGLLIWRTTGRLVESNLAPDAQLLIRLNETTAILRVICFLGLAVFSQMLALDWGDRQLQVAVGLAFCSAVNLAVTALHFHAAAQSSAYRWLDRLVSLSYLGVLLFWIACFSKLPERRIDAA